MIHSSYMKGAYRFVDGGSQLGELLSLNIRDNGGTVMCGMEVTGFRIRDHRIRSVEVNKNECIESEIFISGIHPKGLLG